MLSQYSWWDFFKVIGIGLIIYYAYVGWAYYREDIREWFSSRGQPAPAAVTQDTDEDEPDPGSIFMVKDYSKPVRQQTETAAPVPTPPIIPSPTPPAAPSPAPQPNPVAEQAEESKVNDEEVDLAGPAVSDQPVVAFGLPIADEPQSFAEQSVDDIISAAGRLAIDEQGVLSPIDDDDQPAAKVAAVINNQQGRTVFADFSFTR